MLAIGKVTVGPIHDWTPERGSVVSGTRRATSLAKARGAPMNDVPASHMQAEHLCTYR